MRKVTKVDVMHSFREMWNECTKADPSLRGDVLAKREAWNDYTDSLCKNRVITPWKYNNWTNPY